MFSFQGASLSFLLRSSMKHQRLLLFQSTSYLSSCVVEISGIEPLTSCLQGRRSPSWAKPPYFHLTIFEVVGQNGLEPSTSRLSVVCSSQLSYWPIFAHFFLVEISGIEPLTSCLQGRRSPSWAKPPYLHHSYLGTLFAVPSKLNNAKRFDTLYWP